MKYLSHQSYYCVAGSIWFQWLAVCFITLLLYVGQVFWKCYEYGDDLVQIFEFIDDQRAKSVREIQIPDPEAAEEFIDKHGSIVRSDSTLQL